MKLPTRKPLPSILVFEDEDDEDVMVGFCHNNYIFKTVANYEDLDIHFAICRLNQFSPNLFESSVFGRTLVRELIRRAMSARL